MNQDSLSAIIEILKGLAEFQKCIDTDNECKEISKEHKEVVKQVMMEHLKTRQKKDMQKAYTKILDLDITKKRNECALRKCKDRFHGMLNTIVNILDQTKTTTDIEKKQFKELSKIFKGLKTKMDNKVQLTHEDLTKVAQKIASFQ